MFARSLLIFAEIFQKKRTMKKIMNEKLTISTIHPIRARLYSYPCFTYPWHYHDEYEIIYVEEGAGDCLVGDSLVPYSKGDLFFFGSGLPHSMQSPSGCEQSPEYVVKGVNIQFEKDFMHYSISQYSQFIPIRNLLEESFRGIKLSVPHTGKIVRLLKRIPMAKGAEQIILLLSLLQTIAAGEARKCLTTPHYTHTTAILKNERMEKVIAYLNKHYTESIGLNEIASYIAMNPAAFCRYFKENTGKTFKEYILEMRISYACKLLTSSRMNVSQICVACGFDTPAHFYRVFKRLIGMTPTLYREQME